MSERSFIITVTGPGGEVIRLKQEEAEHRQMIANAIETGIRASWAIEDEEIGPNFRIDPATIPDSLLVTG